MQSAWWIVASRCVTMSVVYFCMSEWSVPMISASVSRSSALVGSSSSRTGAFFRKRPRQADALLLPAAEPHAALAHLRVVAVGQRADELARLRRRGRGLDRRARRLRPAVGDVLQHRAGQQQRVLQHDGDISQQRLLGHVAHVETVEGHAARDGIVEARHEREQRRLARAGAADQRHGLTGFTASVMPRKIGCSAS